MNQRLFIEFPGLVELIAQLLPERSGLLRQVNQSMNQLIHQDKRSKKWIKLESIDLYQYLNQLVLTNIDKFSFLDHSHPSTLINNHQYFIDDITDHLTSRTLAHMLVNLHLSLLDHLFDRCSAKLPHNMVDLIYVGSFYQPDPCAFDWVMHNLNRINKSFHTLDDFCEFITDIDTDKLSQYFHSISYLLNESLANPDAILRSLKVCPELFGTCLEGIRSHVTSSAFDLKQLRQMLQYYLSSNQYHTASCFRLYINDTFGERSGFFTIDEKRSKIIDSIQRNDVEEFENCLQQMKQLVKDEIKMGIKVLECFHNLFLWTKSKCIKYGFVKGIDLIYEHFGKFNQQDVYTEIFETIWINNNLIDYFWNFNATDPKYQMLLIQKIIDSKSSNLNNLIHLMEKNSKNLINLASSIHYYSQAILISDESDPLLVQYLFQRCPNLFAPVSNQEIFVPMIQKIVDESTLNKNDETWPHFLKRLIQISQLNNFDHAPFSLSSIIRLSQTRVVPTCKIDEAAIQHILMNYFTKNEPVRNQSFQLQYNQRGNQIWNQSHTIAIQSSLLLFALKNNLLNVNELKWSYDYNLDNFDEQDNVYAYLYEMGVPFEQNERVWFKLKNLDAMMYLIKIGYPCTKKSSKQHILTQLIQHNRFDLIKVAFPQRCEENWLTTDDQSTTLGLNFYVFGKMNIDYFIDLVELNIVSSNNFGLF